MDVFEERLRRSEKIAAERSVFRKMKTGVNHLRVLPIGGDHNVDYWVEKRQHFSVEPGGKVCPCLLPEPCAICERVGERRAAGQITLANKMESSVQGSFVAVNLDNLDIGPGIYDLDMKWIGMLCAYEADHKALLADLEKGHPLVMRLTKNTAGKNQWSLDLGEMESLGSTPLDPSVVQHNIDLNHWIKTCTYEDQVALLNGDEVTFGRASAQKAPTTVETPVESPEPAGPVSQAGGPPDDPKPDNLNRDWQKLGEDEKPLCFRYHVGPQEEDEMQKIVCQSCTFEQECANVTIPF